MAVLLVALVLAYLVPKILTRAFKPAIRQATALFFRRSVPKSPGDGGDGGDGGAVDSPSQRPSQRFRYFAIRLGDVCDYAASGR